MSTTTAGETTTLPHLDDYERVICGAILTDPANIETVLPLLEPGEVYDERHRLIVRACYGMHARNTVVDALTVKLQLEEDGTLEKVGAPYLCSLTEGIPRILNLPHYAAELRRVAAQRRLICSLNQTLQAALSGNGSLPVALAEHKRLLDVIGADGETAIPFRPPAHWRKLDAAFVREWQCPDLRWIVPDLGISLGALIFVAAMTQTGKTLLLLYLARKMVSGGLIFGKFTVQPVDKVGYYAFEDPERRLRDRYLDHGEADLQPGRLFFYVAPGFRLNDDSCFQYLEETIRKDGLQVVILDTYQKCTPGLSSFRDEDQSIILHKLSELTRKLNVTLIVLDHVRKADNSKRRKGISVDDIKGTGGKAQNSDCYILLERAGAQLKLTAMSKDLDKPVAILLDIAPIGSQQEKFAYACDLQELTTDMKQIGEENRQKILDCFPESTWITREEIEKSAETKESTTRKHLSKLVTDGEIETNGKRGKAIRYCRIRHGENTLWRNATTQPSARD